jgi:hypothetical protein
VVQDPHPQPPGVGALGDQRADNAENGAHIGSGNGFEKVSECIFAMRTQHPFSVLEGDVPAEAGQLVEGRKRVPEASLGVACDRGQSGGLDLDALETSDLREVLLQYLGRGTPEIEALGPGHDRLQDLVSFGRRQNEDDVSRRLFQRLQERVERARRQHVNLVDHIHLGPSLSSCQRNPGQHLPGLVDLGVGRRVHLDDVQRRTFCDRDAGGTAAARRWSRALHAVERLGEYPRGTGFARSARAGEQVGMGNSVVEDRPAQCL